MPTTYNIKQGDTLGNIATANNTSVANLLSANPNITNPNVIQAGSALNIPSPVATQTAVSTGTPTLGAPTIPSTISGMTVAPVASPMVVPAPTTSTVAAGISAGADQTLQDTQASINQSALDTKLAEDLKTRKAATDKAQADSQSTIEKILGVQQSRGQVESELNIPKLSVISNDAFTALQASKRRQDKEVRSVLGDSSLTREQASAKVNAINRGYAFEQADQSIILDVANRNLTNAQATADRKIQLELDPLKTLIDYQTNVLNRNSENLSKAEQNQLNVMIDANKRDLDRKEAELKALSDTKLEYQKIAATTPNIPQGALLEIQQAKTPNDVFKIASKYGIQSVDDKIKAAQLTKINAEVAKIIGESGGNTEDLKAYAAQYATSGTLPSPSALKEAGISAGQVAQFAKELPKEDGEIVSAKTGVKDTKVPTAEQGDFGKLYNIVKNAEKLKELDKKRIGGVVAGGLGFVFGSQAQGEYLTIRKAIVDDISRMQSGAALTLAEQVFYEDYLPGRNSESFGFGQNSDKKIENFANVMNDRLKSGLANNGLLINGYSQVKLPNEAVKAIGRNQATVGEVVEIGGVRYRVLPDGNLTDII